MKFHFIFQSPKTNSVFFDNFSPCKTISFHIEFISTARHLFLFIPLCCLLVRQEAGCRRTEETFKKVCERRKLFY